MNMMANQYFEKFNAIIVKNLPVLLRVLLVHLKKSQLVRLAMMHLVVLAVGTV